MTQQRKRVWIDQDSTIYDLSTLWYALHNKDYPQHNLRIEHVDGWDTQEQCRRNNCPADIYSYFNESSVWTDGGIIDGAKSIIDHWNSQGIADLGVLTTAANGMSMPYKLKWLKDNFPYIKDVVMVVSHVKHLLRGDILIDDKIDNLTEWRNVAILYTQPWNIQDTELLRANDWDEVDWLVRKALALLDQGYAHKHVQELLRSEQRIGL